MPDQPRTRASQPDAALMPRPRVLHWGTGEALPPGTPIRPRYAGVTTPRLSDAVAKFLDAWAQGRSSLLARLEDAAAELALG